VKVGHLYAPKLLGKTKWPHLLVDPSFFFPHPEHVQKQRLQVAVISRFYMVLPDKWKVFYVP
jgi:hypothetical protein